MSSRIWTKRIVVVVAIMATVLPLRAAPAAAAGRDYWFYNGDVCKAQNLSVCLSRTGDMTYGTLYAVSGTTRYKWRAGSGNGSTNRCQTNAGPIPHGNHAVRSGGHSDSYAGSQIRGRVWWMTDARCIWGNPSSTLRTELFIHTEETSSRGQSCTSVTDDPFCWEGDFDYKSLGCIKVQHPTSIADVDSKWHATSDTTPIVVVDA